MTYKNKYTTPNKCGESKDFGKGIYVCKIELMPCPVILGKECTKIKQAEWLDNFAKLINSEVE